MIETERHSIVTGYFPVPIDGDDELVFDKTKEIACAVSSRDSIQYYVGAGEPVSEEDLAVKIGEVYASELIKNAKESQAKIRERHCQMVPVGTLL